MHLAVATDEKSTLAGVDTVTGKRVDLELLHSRNIISQLGRLEAMINAPSIKIRNEREKVY
jgi:hypothetical protein